MKRALVLGGADCVYEDVDRLERSGFVPDVVIACNEIGTVWFGHIDAWVSLHPERFYSNAYGWVHIREKNGLVPAVELIGHKSHPSKHMPSDCVVSNCVFPGMPQQSGSSGMFAAKVALVDYNCDQAVLCGIPMTPTPHFNRKEPWRACSGMQRAWNDIPTVYARGIRSMSGWTSQKFGLPSLLEGMSNV